MIRPQTGNPDLKTRNTARFRVKELQKQLEDKLAERGIEAEAMESEITGGMDKN